MASLLDKVNSHTESVQKKAAHCNTQVCPNCNAKPEKFKRHDCRERILLLVVLGYVKSVVTLLIRWKCPICKRTFTDYPDFILPHKRYASHLILDFSSSYLDDDQATYRQGVEVEGHPLFYTAQSPQSFDDRELAPSTLHRWVSCLGGLKRTLKEALCLIRAQDPNMDFHRRPDFFPPCKYRSDDRRVCLQRASWLKKADRWFRENLGVSIFPHFAIRWG